MTLGKQELLCGNSQGNLLLQRKLRGTKASANGRASSHRPWSVQGLHNTFTGCIIAPRLILNNSNTGRELPEVEWKLQWPKELDSCSQVIWRHELHASCPARHFIYEKGVLTVNALALAGLPVPPPHLDISAFKIILFEGCSRCPKPALVATARVPLRIQ
jgi:hypothetical protein